MWCTQCGVQLEEGSNFCHNCGAPCEPEMQEKQKVLTEGENKETAVVRCSNCGALLFPDDVFCNQCGSPITQVQTEKEEYRCSKCKTEYQPGAQFCSVCGTPLGQSTTREPYTKSSPILTELKQVPSFIRSYFKQPVAATMTVIEKPSLTLLVILFIVYVVTCGIQLFSMLQSFCDVFQSLLQNMFGMFAATFLMDVPLWTSLIFGILYSLLFVLLLSAALFVCTKLLHENYSWGAIVRTIVVQSITPSLLLLASALVTMLSPWLGILLLLLSQITWIVLMVLGLNTLSSRSQSGRFWFPLATLLFIVFLIFNIVVYKTSWQLVQNIKISYNNESMTISEIMEHEGISEAGDFFKAVLGDLF